jgi:hypothetical protein
MLWRLVVQDVQQISQLHDSQIPKEATPRTAHNANYDGRHGVSPSSSGIAHVAHSQMHLRVSMDAVDAAGHWVGNTWCEVYSAKIPKAVR